MRTRADEDTGDDPSPWRRPAFVAAAAFIAVVLVVGLAVVLWPRGASSEDPPTATTTTDPSPTPTTSTPTPGSDDESVCGLEPGPQAIPATAPEGAEWELFGTFAAPSVEGVGPGLVADDGLRHCFAHSPMGALLASVNYVAMGFVDPVHGIDERLVADSPETRDRQEYRDAHPDEPLDEPPAMQVAGFQIRDYAPDSVVVELVMRLPEGGLLLWPTPLRWEAGDWKFLYPATGDTGFREVDSLAGYVTWAGV